MHGISLFRWSYSYSPMLLLMLDTGSAIMSQFIKTFKELAEFYKQLMNQVQCESGV